MSPLRYGPPTRLPVPLLLTAGLVAAVLTIGQAPAMAERAPDSIAPPPRESHARADGFPITPLVGLVRATDADQHAEGVVRQVLRSAGVRHIRTTDGADPRTPVTVWLGDGSAALAELEVEAAAGLPDEGYVLAAGQAGQRKHIVLDGVDADGTYYAAQSLRQLVRPGAGTARMPGVEVRDWPTMRYRGSIEGFYGTPWSHADRLDHLDYLGAHKMNTYEYAPKDDPYHRERWREPYPPDKLAELGELITRAARNHVDFTFAVSPGLSICYSSPDDLVALLAKFDSIYALGGRAFNVALDDIDAGRWNCAADLDRYGPPGAGAAGRAQSDLLNAVQAWVRDKGDIAPLQMVPTEYYNATESPYKKALRETLDQQVIVHWTGLGVIPTAITKADAARARQVFGHQILVWDNYPVNDYIAGQLPLAAYTGREPGLSEELVGIISNPMNQATVSKIALYSFADFGWHDTAYDADASWRRALAERAGGDRKTAAALADLADLSTYDGTLHETRAPRLAAEIATFWPAWHAGSPTSLRALASRLHAAPDVIRTGMPERAFTAEADAWLQATDVWTAAMLAALDLLDAVRAGDGAAGLAARDRAVALMAQAKEIRDVREPHSRTYPRIADGVLDTFIADAFREYDRWLGLPPRPAAATTLGTYQDNTADRMVDGSLDSFYWSDGAPGAGDAVTVDLGAVKSIADIAVLMGKPSSPNDFIPAGVLEYSADGQEWTALAEGTTAEVRATAPAGTTARYVRYRATTGSDFWLVVREFAVSTPDDPVWTVSGTPAGTDPAAAADRNLDTAWVAGSAPAAGDALVAVLDKPRAIAELTVLGTGTARVSLRVAGAWQDIGALTAPYTELAAGVTADAVRLEWTPGSAAPRIREIAARFG